jgi:hypothetical protein
MVCVGAGLLRAIMLSNIAPLLNSGGKWPVMANKERQNLPTVIIILLFLKFLLSHLTGKIYAES